ncbi:hypothetical protein [Sphingopyxis sp.]|uniref:hypothetical protein n=1 Tax=Sphingopyxis sp. TaxID=1908224 RepID=UPI003BA9966A
MADWVTVTAYLLAAIVSAWAATHASLRREARERTFWQVTAVLLVFLGINELLDLQTLLTMIGRANAKANGWYPEHRRIQYLFIIGLTVATAVAGLVVLWLTRRAHAMVRLALMGLGFIGLFVLLRAASFHHFDDLLGRGAPSFNWGSIQEMAGIIIVAGAAALYTRKPRGKTMRWRVL